MKWKNYLLTGLGAVVLCLAATFGFLAVSVHAETGAVYSCNINRCYSHPVTGEIEDSGGEASYATGQGMVEGAVYGSGLMEVTDSGNYYLTIRMSLIDYTSNHSFSVQNVGDSGWSGTGIAVTGNGSDSNGSTSDICMQVPSENCIVRVSMYVSPMGRDVTFYLYPSDYSEGNSVGMNQRQHLHRIPAVRKAFPMVRWIPEAGKKLRLPRRVKISQEKKQRQRKAQKVTKPEVRVMLRLPRRQQPETVPAGMQMP